MWDRYISKCSVCQAYTSFSYLRDSNNEDTGDVGCDNCDHIFGINEEKPASLNSTDLHMILEDPDEPPEAKKRVEALLEDVSNWESQVDRYNSPAYD
jgi:hypothetical protein